MKYFSKKSSLCLAIAILILSSIVFYVPVKASETNNTISTQETKQKTSKKYKKYVGKWVSVDTKLKIKVINKNYIHAILINKKGEKITFKQKMNPKNKTQKFVLRTKNDDKVVLRLKLKYGKAYTSYGGKRCVDGPAFHIESDNFNWVDGFKQANGKRAFILFQKYL